MTERIFLSVLLIPTTYTNRNSGEVTKNTTWVSCTMNGDGGNLLQYLKSGEKVYVRGISPAAFLSGMTGKDTRD